MPSADKPTADIVGMMRDSGLIGKSQMMNFHRIFQLPYYNKV